MLILSDVCDPSHITADFLRHGISVLKKKKKKKKKNYIVGEKLENNKLEQFSGTQSFFNHHCPNCWQITEKLLAKISGLENKISIVPQALSEETTAKLELQHEVKTLYKKYKVVSDQLEKRLKN